MSDMSRLRASQGRECRITGLGRGDGIDGHGGLLGSIRIDYPTLPGEDHRPERVHLRDLGS
jgi:hypothetical protein